MRKAMIRVQAGSLEQSLADPGAAFKRAWATGEYQVEEFVFDSTDTLFRAITPRRWELMDVLQRRSPMSLRALARDLGRDIKNVHADVGRSQGDRPLRGPRAGYLGALSGDRGSPPAGCLSARSALRDPGQRDRGRPLLSDSELKEAHEYYRD